MFVQAVVGREEPGVRVRGIRRWPVHDFSMQVPFGFVNEAIAPPDLRIAAVCHMFYP